MKRSQHPTADGFMVFRCMFVGFDEPTEAVCKLAITPLAAIMVRNVADACRGISTILPLVVFLSERAPDDDVPELIELARACGAEVVTLPHPLDEAALGSTIREALRKGEARRVAR